MQLARSVNRKALAEAQRLLPMVVADARQVAVDSPHLSEVLQNLARRNGHRHRCPVRRPRSPGRGRAAAVAGRRALRAAGLSAVRGQRRQRHGRGDKPTRRRATAHRGAARADRAGRPAGARAGDHAQLPALRGVSLHRGDPRDQADRRRRAPLRRSVHRGGDERQRARHPADLAASPRGADHVAGRPQPPRPADAGHPPDHPALGAVRADRRADVRDGHRRRRTRLAPAGAAVPARRPARALRVQPGLPAPRPLHHGGPAGHAGHPGPRVRRTEHRLHRPGQRITLGGGAFHGAAARLVHPPVDRHHRGEPRPRAGAAHRGAAHLGRPADRRGQDRVDRPVDGRALRRRPARGVQAGRQTVRGDHRHRLHRSAAGELGQTPVRAGRRGSRRLPHLVPRRLDRLAEPPASDAAVHGCAGARGAAVHRRPSRWAESLDLPVQDPARCVDAGHRRRRSGTPPRNGSPTR